MEKRMKKKDSPKSLAWEWCKTVTSQMSWAGVSVKRVQWHNARMLINRS